MKYKMNSAPVMENAIFLIYMPLKCKIVKETQSEKR